MEYKHEPVLLAEAIRELIYTNIGTFVDCTLGGAGHSKAILEKLKPSSFLVAIDKDVVAIDKAYSSLKSFSRQIFLKSGSFSQIDQILSQAGVGKVNGFLFDLGISSVQVDDPLRGFSYKNQGRLDMRMDINQKLSAYQIVNEYSKKDLTRIIRLYGEESWASRIAGFIVERRTKKPIKNTFELVDIIKAAIPASARRKGGHPAKRVFQAIRIEVNNELDDLKVGLQSCVKWLVSGGRIVVLTYHSLEDRIVKKFFQEQSKGCVCPSNIVQCVCNQKPKIKTLTRKPIVPTEAEIAQNPRARSAKLRVGEKI